MTETSFFAPVRVLGKERPRGRSRRARTPSKTKSCEAAIRAYALADGVRPCDGRVSVRIECRYRGHVIPDLDNAVKTVLDALNGIAYADDRQVAHIDASRFDGWDADGLVVEITPLLIAR